VSNHYADSWSEKFTVEVFQDDNYCNYRIVDLCGDVIGSGVSKRDPQDKPDWEIGYALAQARAFESVSKRKFRRAAGLQKHAEDVETSKANRVVEPSFASLEDLLDHFVSLGVDLGAGYGEPTVTHNVPSAGFWS
jgi:hypothetical protein